MAWYSPIPSHPGTSTAPLPAPEVRSTGPARVVRTALPILLVLLVCVGIYPATSPRRPDTAVARFLPQGPRIDYLQVGDQVWQGTQAVLPAVVGYTGLARPTRDALGYGDDLAAPELTGPWVRVDYLRPGTEGVLRTASYHVGPDAITLQALETADSWVTFHPGLPVLVADLGPGTSQRWSGTITSSVDAADSTAEPVSATVSADAAPQPDCTATTLQLTYGDGSVHTRVSTWCSGNQAGWAADLVDGTGLTRTDRPPAEHPPPDLTVAPTVSPTATGAVHPARFYRLVDDRFHELSPMSPRGSAMAGSVLVTTGSDGQLQGWAPPADSDPGESSRYLRWRAWPGGLLSALDTVGSVTVVGSTADQVTGYADDGWRLWQVPTDDVVSVVLRCGDAVLVADAGGTVRLLDPRTGAERWSRRFTAGARPVVGGSHVAVLTEDRITVLDARTGEQRWQRDVPASTQVAVSGDVVVTKLGSWLVARSAASGDTLWWRTVDRQGVGLTATDDLIVLIGTRSTVAYAPDGALRWTAAPAQAGRQVASLTALTFADRVELWGADGLLRGSPYVDGYGAPDQNLQITDRGVLLYQPSAMDSDWWEYR